MKIFISSRKEDSLEYNCVNSLVESGNILFYDLETVQNNNEVIDKLIDNHICTMCQGKGYIEQSVDNITYDETCPMCHGKKVHFPINVITNAGKDNIIADDKIMDNIIAAVTKNEEEMYHIIMEACDCAMVFCGDVIYTLDKTDMKNNFLLEKKLTK